MGAATATDLQTCGPERWGSRKLSCCYLGAAVTALCLQPPPPPCSWRPPNTRLCATREQALTPQPPLRQRTPEPPRPSGSAHPARPLLRGAQACTDLRPTPLGCILISAELWVLEAQASALFSVAHFPPSPQCAKPLRQNVENEI